MGSTTTDDPVARLIEMLQTLIGPGLSPAQLTSMLQGPPPASVEAFSAALAYFERPNRSLILQDLYSRVSWPASLACGRRTDGLSASGASHGSRGVWLRRTRAFSRSDANTLYVGAAIAGVVVVAVLVGFLWRARTARCESSDRSDVEFEGCRWRVGCCWCRGQCGEVHRPTRRDRQRPTAASAGRTCAACGSGARRCVRPGARFVKAGDPRVPAHSSFNGGSSRRPAWPFQVASPIEPWQLPESAPAARDGDSVDGSVYSAGAAECDPAGRTAAPRPQGVAARHQSREHCEDRNRRRFPRHRRVCQITRAAAHERCDAAERRQGVAFSASKQERDAGLLSDDDLGGAVDQSGRSPLHALEFIQVTSS